MHQHRGQPGSFKRRLGYCHLFGGCPLHAPAAARGRRNAPPGTMVEVRGWEDDEVRGQVRQAEHTYTVVGLMNEHQLSLGETTTGGPARAGRPQGPARLRRPDAADPSAGQDRPRGHHGHRRAVQGIRLRQLRRDVLDRRQERSLDHGADRQGPRPQGNCLGRCPRARRLYHGPCQYEPDHDLPAQRSGELALLSGRDLVRDREGLLQDRLGQAVQLPRRLPSRARAPIRSGPAPAGSGAFTAVRPPAATSPTPTFRGVEGAEDYPLFVKPDKPLSRSST